ncbi:hypothetical protein AMTR_s00084p00048260 [Amborella trichopoda]|uniref:Uncharacterized protein n=1 Tax=Amborella trichopoda TaxID=13333 RepID=W1P3Y4_AMBTC|nr:hypothetical protein AMTR_s00084p00048260 [Amborella trichopoda]
MNLKSTEIMTFRFGRMFGVVCSSQVDTFVRGTCQITCFGSLDSTKRYRQIPYNGRGGRQRGRCLRTRETSFDIR